MNGDRTHAAGGVIAVIDLIATRVSHTAQLAGSTAAGAVPIRDAVYQRLAARSDSLGLAGHFAEVGVRIKIGVKSIGSVKLTLADDRKPKQRPRHVCAPA